MSKAQVFMSQNPGISYDEAVEELVRVRLEDQEIEARVAPDVSDEETGDEPTA